MRIGIRAKLVVLLVAVGVLPLTGALVTILITGGQMRVQSIAEIVLARAQAEARDLRFDLLQAVHDLELVLTAPAVLEPLRSPEPSRSPEQWARLDRAWPTLDEDDPRVRAFLSNPAAEVIRRLDRAQTEVSEILVTDRHGRLVASSRKTTDLYQADETWWQQAWAEGTGRIYISDVYFDDSAGAWGISVAMPVMAGTEPVGVAKAVVNLPRWLGSARRPVAGQSAMLMLLQADGMIVYRHNTPPLTEQAAGWNEITAGMASNWRITREGEIQGYLPLAMPERIGLLEVKHPRWFLVLYMPQEQALAVVYRLGMRILSVGLVIIGAIFLLSLALVDRSLVRRIRPLAKATRMVAEGDLSHRIRTGTSRRLLGADEIDELAEDFNRMVNRIQASYRELAEAGELKERFVKIAGHELRTPIAYILASVKLLKDSHDVHRMRLALRSIGDKCERLNDTLQEMFKIMPDSPYLEEVRYRDVDLRAAIQQVLADAAPFVERRRQQVHLEMPDDLPRLRADAYKLSDILISLLMNAVKFSPDEGTIRIAVGQEVGDRVAISITDSGPGIPQSELPHLFKPFYSGGDVMQHSSGQGGYQKRGLGLGLTIVRQFTELHGGEVRVKSSAKGATFTVVLPLKPPNRGPEGLAQ